MAYVIQGLGNRAIPSFLTANDFHQEHFFNWAEKVDANELIRAARCLGQFGNWQGRGVGGKDAILWDHGLDCGGDFGLDFGVFKNRLNDQVRIRKGRVIRGCGDTIQQGLFLFFGGFAAFDALVHIACAIGLAAICVFLGLINQDNVDPCLGRDQCNTRTHHARAQNAYFFDALIWDACGAHGAFFQGSFVDEQTADHRRGGGVHHDIREPTRLDL